MKTLHKKIGISMLVLFGALAKEAPRWPITTAMWRSGRFHRRAADGPGDYAPYYGYPYAYGYPGYALPLVVA